MKIRFVKNVITPPDKAGKVGDVKELKNEIAEWLIANGYAESAEQIAKDEGSTSDNNADSTNTGSDESPKDNTNEQKAE